MAQQSVSRRVGILNNEPLLLLLRSLKAPPKDFGPLLNFIGCVLEGTEQPSPYDWFVEQGSVCPTELQEAMRRARLHQVKQGALD